MRLNNRFLTSVVFLSLAVTTVVSAQDAPAPTTAQIGAQQIHIVDTRPSNESSGGYLSIMPYNCNFFISRLSDTKMLKGRMEILAERLNSYNSGAISRPIKEVVVQHFGIYLNGATFARNDQKLAGAAATASISAQANGIGTSSTYIDGWPSAVCSEQKTPNGWFSQAEINGPFSPIIAQLDVLIDNHQYVLRKVVSPDKEMNGGHRVDQAIWKEKAVHKIIDDLLMLVQRDAK